MDLLFPLGLLLVTFVTGRVIERRHFASLERREQRSRSFPVTTAGTLAGDPAIAEATLVTGSVVVSPDYFRRVVGALRSIVGGSIPGYERLLERARREAILRMKESAFAAGYRGIVNLRLESVRLASSSGDGKGTSGVEILAVGTALRPARR